MANYYGFMELTRPKEEKKIHTNSQRNEMAKSVWLTRDGERYENFLTSEDSFVQIRPKEKGMRVVENMDKIVCFMQQKLFVDSNGNPWQQIFHFTADKGSYDYAKKYFQAYDVDLWMIQVPGHDLQKELKEEDTLVMEGHCDSLNFFFLDDNTKLETHNLVSTIHTKERVL